MEDMASAFGGPSRISLEAGFIADSGDRERRWSAPGV